jgi:hypothetical protein
MARLIWPTARSVAISRRTKPSKSSVCPAQSTGSTKPRPAQGGGRANPAAPSEGLWGQTSRRKTRERLTLVVSCMKGWAEQRVAAKLEPAGLGAGGLSQTKCVRSELSGQVAVDFESDADFHECGSCPHTGPPSPADNAHRTAHQSTRQLPLPNPNRGRRKPIRHASTPAV